MDKISHPDKILFPGENITKEDVARYYKEIAPYMVPLIKNHPLTLRNFPQGIDRQGFFQKRTPDYFPNFIQRVEVPLRTQKDEVIQMVMADKPKDLVYFASQNVIEIHMGLSHIKALEKTDQIIFDLDLSKDDFEKVREVAFIIKELLEEEGLSSFVKTTGSKGVHIHVPVHDLQIFTKAKEFAKKIAEKAQKKHPEIITLEHRKDKRGEKVFLDYLRNDYGMTAIAPYSLRALKNAPVATPISWNELKDKVLGPQTYTMRNIGAYLKAHKNPWKNFYQNCAQ